MSKRYDEQQLLDYVEGNLSPAERERVEQSLRGQPELLAYLQAMSGDRQAIADLPEPEAPAWIMEEVDRYLERSMLLDTNGADLEADNHRQRSVLRRLFVVGALAAMLLVTVGIIALSVWGLGEAPMTTRTVARDGRPDAEAAVVDEVADAEPPTAVAMDRRGGGLTERAVQGKLATQDPRPPAPAAAANDAIVGKAGPAAVPDVEMPPLADEPVVAKAGRMPDEAPPVAESPLQVEPDLDRNDPMKTAQALVAEQARQAGEAAGAPVGAPLLGATLARTPQGEPVDLTDARPIEDIEILVQTEDLPQSVAQLNTVAGNLRSAELREARDLAKVASKTSTTTTTARRYTVTVPEDQVMALVRQLKQPLDGNRQRIVVNTIQTTTTTVTSRRTMVLRALTGGGAWPEKTPDYARIVREQLPLSAEDEPPTVQASRRVTVPVIVEQMSPDEQTSDR